jgi:hypothetical protein
MNRRKQMIVNRVDELLQGRGAFGGASGQSLKYRQHINGIRYEPEFRRKRYDLTQMGEKNFAPGPSPHMDPWQVPVHPLQPVNPVGIEQEGNEMRGLFGEGRHGVPINIGGSNGRLVYRGNGIFDWIKDNILPIAQTVAPFAKLALGVGKKTKRAPSERNKMISQLMKEHGMTLPEASSYLKQNGY